MVKLTNRKIKWAINQVVKHKKSTKTVAQSLRVSQRRIQQLVKAYRDTGEYPTLNPNRRPRTYLTEEEKNIIEKAYNESYLGVQRNRNRKSYKWFG